MKEVHILQDVRGLETLKLSLPLEVSADFKPLESKVHELSIAFFGPRGGQFGQEF